MFGARCPSLYAVRRRRSVRGVGRGPGWDAGTAPAQQPPMGVTPPHLGLAFPVPPGPATTCKPLPEPRGNWDHPEPWMLSEPIAGTRAPHAEVPGGLTCWQVFLVRVSGTGCVPLSSPEIGSGTWRGSRWSSRSCCAGRGWATGSSSAPRRAGNAWPTTPSCCWADPGGASPSPCEGRPQHLLAPHPPRPGRVSSGRTYVTPIFGWAASLIIKHGTLTRLGSCTLRDAVIPRSHPGTALRAGVIPRRDDFSRSALALTHCGSSPSPTPCPHPRPHLRVPIPVPVPIPMP